MKKKLVSLAMVVIMIAIMLSSFTMAYFTDTTQVEQNAFAVGNVDITLAEEVAHVDGVGKTKVATTDGITYENVLPGDVMTKIVTVKNNGTSDAYVALAVKMADLVTFQTTLEGVYNDDKMATLVPEIFSGTDWNMNHGKNNPNTPGVDTMRFVPTTDVVDADGSEDYRDATATTLISIDAVKKIFNESRNQNFINYHLANMFGKDAFGYITEDSSLTKGYTVYPYSDSTTTTPGSNHLYDFQETAVYADELVSGEQLWVFYYFLPAGESVTLDLSMTCPTEITGETIAAFDCIDLDIRATAIQVDGFATAKDAFTELNKTYGYGY